MSETYVSNLGISFRFNDINNISDHRYLVDGQSDKFDCAWLWSYVKEYPVNPTQPFITSGTDEEREAMNEQYFWLFGDAFKGGIAFANNGNSMTRFLYATSTETYFSSANIPTTGWFYLYINELFSMEESEFAYAVESWQGGAELKAQNVVIHPTVPPTWTIGWATTPFTALPKGFDVQATWDYFGVDAPKGVINNPTTSDGLNIEIAGHTVGIILSPFINAGSRFTKVPWYDFVEKRDKDPDDDAPESSPAGGDGTPQDSIDIDFPDLPPDMLINSGIVNTFNPSASDMRSLMEYIYSQPDAFYTNLKKIWANPMESIISFSIVPFEVDQGASAEIKFCGLGTGIYMPTVASQYKTVDCGFLDLPEEYASFLDYGAFTKIKCWCPFIGIVDLNTDDVIGARLTMRYNIDIFTGECVCFIKSTKQVERNHVDYNSVIYAFNGNCLMQAPLTGNNYQGLYGSILNLATHVALPVVTPSKTAVAAVTGAAAAMGSAGSELISEKVNVQRSGTAVGNTGMLAYYTPYVIIERPVRNRPANNGKYNGYPLNATGNLNGYIGGKNMVGSGFTIVRDGTVRIYDGSITDAELQMIKDLLETGVII